MHRYIVYTYLFVLLSNFGYGQNYSYQQFTTEDGLPTNYVYGVLEDREGYIWVYTENGVSKFDGHEFKNFSVADGLINNDIIFMEEDSSGVLWLHGLQNSIQYIENDSIHIFKGLNKNDILKARKFFCNPNQIEYRIKNDDNAGFMKIHLNTTGIIDSVKSPAIYSTDKNFRDNYNSLHFTSFNNNRIYNISSDGYTYYEIIQDSLYSWKLQHPLLKTKKNTFTIYPILCSKPYNLSISKDHIVFFDMITSRYKRVNATKLFGGNANELTAQIKNDLLIIQSSLGYIEFDVEWNIKDLIIFEKKVQQYSIKRSIKDSKGNLWVGTRDAGLLLYTSSYILNPIINSHLVNNESFGKLIENSKREIYALSDNMELCLLQNDEIISYTKLKLGSPHIRNIAIGPNEDLIISNALKTKIISKGKSIDLINYPYFKSLQNQFSKNDLLNLRRFNDLYFNAEKDQLFCSSPTQNAFVLSKINDHFIKNDLNVTGKLFFHDKINDIVYLSNSELLFKITNTWSVKQELKLKAITSFLSIDKDSYLLGTESNGLYHYQLSTKKLSQLNNHQYIRKISKEGNYYYLASNEGVIVGEIIDTEWKPVYTFNKKDGLQSEEIRDILIQKDYIYATSFKGIIKLAKQSILDHKKMSLTNGALSINEIYSISKNTDITRPNPTLSYNENDISFKYHLQNYDSNGDIKYEYKLDPIQSDWQSTSERTQRFFNLQAASYTFHIKATDAFGHEYYLQEPYTFIIKNPFWKTEWFILTCMFFIAFGIFQFLKFKAQRADREVKLQKELNDKIASFKIDALRSQMNPHFVFNALSSIQYYIQKNNVQKADKYLTMFGGLIRKYLDFSQVKTITLKQEIELLQDYLRLEEMRFESLFTSEITVDPRLDLHYSYIPTMLVQPYIENAINHGLQQRRDGKGILWVEFKKIYTDGLRISINDNGIGIENSKKNKSDYHKSHGMSNIMDRIKFLKESQELEINLQIKTVSSNSEFPGTKIIIEIKEL